MTSLLSANHCSHGLPVASLMDRKGHIHRLSETVASKKIRKKRIRTTKKKRALKSMTVSELRKSIILTLFSTLHPNLQDYTATIFLRQRWTDERLVFEGNKSLSLDGRLVELLWVPDTFIVDSKKSFLHDITVENRLIRIFPNGTVLYALR